MSLLLKSVNVVCPGSTWHQQVVDILIVDGIVSEIALHIQVPENCRVIHQRGWHLSPGFVELHAHFGTPGNEDRETIETGVRAAIAGGFTHVAIVPDNQPTTDCASAVSYINKQNEQVPVQLIPLGAVSKGLKGLELAEIYDMHAQGARAFYDHKCPITNPNLLKLALQYTKVVQAPVFTHPFDKSLAVNGSMHEGPTSTFLGMHGMPALSEEVMVQRDLAIQQYAGGRLHFAGISSAGAASCMAGAGKNCTADVAFYNLIETTEALEGYDSHYKVNPPIREKADVAALWNALEQGHIHAISTDHIPWNVERKQCEFELAAFGMAAIENAFAALLTHKPAALELGTLIRALSHGPREILGLPKADVAVGKPADFTLFQTEAHLPTDRKRQSAAKNDPYQHLELKGRVCGVIFHQFDNLT
jgi:dihydroorotase